MTDNTRRRQTIARQELEALSSSSMPFGRRSHASGPEKDARKVSKTCSDENKDSLLDALVLSPRRVHEPGNTSWKEDSPFDREAPASKAATESDVSTYPAVVGQEASRKELEYHDCLESVPGAIYVESPVSNALSASGDGADKKLRNIMSWGKGRKSPKGQSNTEVTRTPENGGENAKSPRASSLLPPRFHDTFLIRSPELTDVSRRNSWASALIALLNNGLRAELRDLYRMLSGMNERALTLTSDDMRIFFTWFMTFSTIVRLIFDVEEQGLYPWIEGGDLLSPEEMKWKNSPRSVKGQLSAGRRMRMKGEILQNLNSVAAYDKKMFEGRPVGELLGSLANVLDTFVVSLMTYMDLKEEVLPVCIEQSGLTIRDRKRCEESCWNALERVAEDRDSVGMVVIAVSRGMNRRVLDKWKRKYLTFCSSREYSAWQRAFSDTHCSALAELDARIEHDKKVREEQAAENEAVRARAGDISNALAYGTCDEEESLCSGTTASACFQ